jgi:TonB family protein
MSARTQSEKETSSHRAFLVTTFSKKPPGRNEPSADILQSEVWDSRDPFALGFPLRWVLQKTGEHVRIRDLGNDDDGTISHPIEEIAIDELGRRGALELTPGDDPKRRCWVLIQPVRELTAIRDEAPGTWIPPILRPIAASEIPAQRFLKKTTIGVTAALLLAWLALYLIPKKQTEEELVPEEFAKVLLSPALKSLTEATHHAGGAGGNVNVVQAFQSAAVQKSTKTLLTSQADKALLSSSSLLNTAQSSATARKVFDAQSELSTQRMPNQKLDVASRDVGMIGGKAGQTGYSQGSAAAVAGQGHSLVSVGQEMVNVSEGLTKDEVGKVIREHMNEVRYCYDAALVRNPTFEGKLVAGFVVTRNGTVSSTEVKDSSHDPQLDRCIMVRLAKWQFPKPRGGVNVAISYPFIFKVLGN